MPRGGGSERRGTLVEEAIRQIGREGYKGASLESIASAVGVRKQTLLYYFPTKDALLEACLAAAGERLASDLAAALRARSRTGRGPRPCSTRCSVSRRNGQSSRCSSARRGAWARRRSTGSPR